MTNILRFLFVCTLVTLLMVYVCGSSVRVGQVVQGMYRWQCVFVEWGGDVSE
jgi:hypothetical protein